MKWVLNSNRSAIVHEYQLMDENSCMATAKINPLHHSVRISCYGQHRLFFIEQQASLSTKYIFTNEYGLEVGNMAVGKLKQKEGAVAIESKKYFYQIQNNSLPNLHIYEGDKMEALFSCNLQANNTGICYSCNSDGEIDTQCLLLATCWYLHLPVAKKNTMAFAV